MLVICEGVEVLLRQRKTLGLAAVDEVTR